MNYKLIWKTIPVFILFVFDFSFQNFNPIEMKFSTCKIYLFTNECCTFEAFLLNKLLRLLLNLFTIHLILGIFKIELTNKLYYIIIISFLFIIDMAMCYSMHPLFSNWHKVLNPVLYSPLAGVALLAWFVSTKQNQKV
ncbi:MAG: hypothetical protein ACOYMA_18750 [Bacteroidia bacterium]